ncbi:hypothetical protein LCGC14_1239560 [marine sediment metagenome]|uniref:Uncharacterized protein n=1 Tax=marine sediment metagenome TaxID=412755 RepID=A0A0F9L6G5_9ZZZZ
MLWIAGTIFDGFIDGSAACLSIIKGVKSRFFIVIDTTSRILITCGIAQQVVSGKLRSNK